MVYVSKEELRKIFDRLSKEITPEDKEWLKRNREVTFKDIPDGLTEDENWENWVKDIVEASRIDTSFTIQNILDAKKRRVEMGFGFADGLPKNRLIEIAGVFGLKVSEKMPARQILSEILQFIKINK